jgi:hypothetical protein
MYVIINHETILLSMKDYECTKKYQKLLLILFVILPLDPPTNMKTFYATSVCTPKNRIREVQR